MTQGIVAVEALKDHVALVERARGFDHLPAALPSRWCDRLGVGYEMKASDVDMFAALVIVTISEHMHTVQPRCLSRMSGAALSMV